MQILAVVVRYNIPLAESQTIQGLCEALGADPGLAEAYRVLIWDNSPEPLIDPHLPIPFVYRHSERNLGVSGAYNGATAVALECGIIWMLLLDQDSTVTGDFLRIMLAHARSLANHTEIAAIAPIVIVGNTVMSPKKHVFNKTVPYPAGSSCVLDGRAVAINSGCIIRAVALATIGGFSTDFWLDYSDIDVFNRFHACGMRVWRASDARLDHEMSIMDYDRLMTPWRYENFSKAESAFNDLYRGLIENTFQSIRFLLRAIKQKFKYTNPAFSRIAWQTFTYRMTTSRAARIAQWKAESVKRVS